MPIRALSILILTLAFVGSPLFSTFNGFNPDLYPNPQIDPPVQPAGYAFSIWGIIYLWLTVSAIFGLWKRADHTSWDAARVPLMVSLAVGVPWLAVAGVSPLGATAMIWTMLIAALIALTRMPVDNRAMFAEPVGLYAGWLTAASCVSIGLMGDGFNVAALGQIGWAFVALGVALLISVTMLLRHPTWAYGVAVSWALVGIFVQNGTGALGITALAMAIGIAGLTVWRNLHH